MDCLSPPSHDDLFPTSPGLGFAPMGPSDHHAQQPPTMTPVTHPLALGPTLHTPTPQLWQRDQSDTWLTMGAGGGVLGGVSHSSPALSPNFFVSRSPRGGALHGGDRGQMVDSPMGLIPSGGGGGSNSNSPRPVPHWRDAMQHWHGASLTSPKRHSRGTSATQAAGLTPTTFFSLATPGGMILTGADPGYHMRQPVLLSSASGDMTVQFSDLRCTEEQQMVLDAEVYSNSVSCDSSSERDSAYSRLSSPGSMRPPSSCASVTPPPSRASYSPIAAKRPQAAANLVVSELIHAQRRRKTENQAPPSADLHLVALADYPHNPVVAATVMKAPTVATVARRGKAPSRRASGKSKAAAFESQQQLAPLGVASAVGSSKAIVVSASLPSSRASSPKTIPGPINLRRSGTANPKVAPRVQRPKSGRLSRSSSMEEHTMACGTDASSAPVQHHPPPVRSADGVNPKLLVPIPILPTAAASSNSLAAAVAASTSIMSTTPSSSSASSAVEFRLECGSGTSHFEYGRLPILWRKASQRKDHALVPTYIYLYPRVESISHITLVVDSHMIVVPKSKDVNVKNAHLSNFALGDSEQHALFQLIQNEGGKRKPDVIANGVKLHAMHLIIDRQKIPFYYCSQKRITIEKAFASLTASSSSGPCECAGECLSSSLGHLQLQLHHFLKLDGLVSAQASPGGGSATTSAAAASSTSTLSPMPRHSPAQQYDQLVAMLDDVKKQFVAHRRTLVARSKGGASTRATHAAGRPRSTPKRGAASTRKQTTRRTGEDRYVMSDTSEVEEPEEEEPEAEEESE